MVPPHDAAHGFRHGRSVLTFAAPHARQGCVVRLDLEGFFGAVTAGRVYGVWLGVGYPPAVAHLLTGLVTTSVEPALWAARPRLAAGTDPRLVDATARLGMALRQPHLPQGAPTSPALANLVAYRLDHRLAGLAASFGAVYTRYADDLALSGHARLAQASGRLVAAVGRIARDEGFRLAPAKTAVATQAGRQRLAGLVVNAGPHVPRAERDRLRAVLHDCMLHGPVAANRDGRPDFRAHLVGRVAWVAQVDPAQGARLARMLNQVDWS